MARKRFFGLSFSDDEWQSIEKAAARAERTVTDWLRRTVVNAARVRRRRKAKG